jgi:hypothetical protein
VQNPAHTWSANGMMYHEYHVDRFEGVHALKGKLRRLSVRACNPEVRLETCSRGHSGICKCHKPLFYVGQDESICKAYGKSNGCVG